MSCLFVSLSSLLIVSHASYPLSSLCPQNVTKLLPALVLDFVQRRFAQTLQQLATLAVPEVPRAVSDASVTACLRCFLCFSHSFPSFASSALP